MAPHPSFADRVRRGLLPQAENQRKLSAMDSRRVASIAAVVLGIVMIIGGITTWVIVSNTLADQRITTSEDACLPDRTVRDPFTAYCQAKVIDKHVLEATDGKTYAELDQDDPLRQTAMNGSFLQASLFTSVLAFGLAAMAAAIGLLFILIGLGMREVSTVKGIRDGTAAETGTSPGDDTGS